MNKLRVFLLAAGASLGLGCSEPELHEHRWDDIEVEEGEALDELEDAETGGTDSEDLLDVDGEEIDGLRADGLESEAVGALCRLGANRGWNSLPDCGAGEFCGALGGGGQCSRVMGRCIAQPPSCPPGGTAVCGCDGQDYGSECHAHLAGVSVSYGGSCTPGSLD
ncbi:MAG: Kazal-type serine protease inhibitor family protein [Nannocystales bacterium]